MDCRCGPPPLSVALRPNSNAGRCADRSRMADESWQSRTCERLRKLFERGAHKQSQARRRKSRFGHRNQPQKRARVERGSAAARAMGCGREPWHPTVAPERGTRAWHPSVAPERECEPSAEGLWSRSVPRALSRWQGPRRTVGQQVFDDRDPAPRGVSSGVRSPSRRTRHPVCRSAGRDR